MNSFFLPIGKSAGAALPSVLSALSSGAALPLTGLDILFLTDGEPDPIIPALISDLNQAHRLLNVPGDPVLFPSSFLYESFKPSLPSAISLSKDPGSAALLAALRGKGIPLAYRTDREAVEWAFSALLSDRFNDGLVPFRAWERRIMELVENKEDLRVSVLCDLCDPFSVGTAFAVLRYLNETVRLPSSSVALFCLAKREPLEDSSGSACMVSALHALADQNLISSPLEAGEACAATVWLLSMPSSLARTEGSWRVLYAVLARKLAQFHTVEKLPAPGLHTAELPGILSLSALDREAKPFAAFLHVSTWLLADLLPALASYLNHPGALRSLAPNTRSGLFRRLFQSEKDSREASEILPVLERVLKAVLSECVSLIRFLPDPLRLADVSTPLWDRAVDACGRTVTVASEYEVLRQETEEAGIMDVKPVHRVSMADTEEEKQLRRLEDIAVQLQQETDARNQVFRALGSSRAWLVLRDCKKRCLDALKRAEEQLAVLSEASDIPHISLASQARRVRLLNAAVVCCDRDLSDRNLLRELAEPSDVVSSSLSPFAGQILSEAAAEKIAALLTSAGDALEPVRKDLRSLFPSLLYGFQLSDAKTLLRLLQSACREESDRSPLNALIMAALRVSCEEVASLRFLSAGVLPSVPLLPDLYPSETPVTVSSLLPLLGEPSTAADSEGGKRGLLALLLLSQYRRRTALDPALSMEMYRGDSSPVIRSWLASRNSDKVWIISFGKGNERLPFALILPGRDLLPARMTQAHKQLLPSFATPWFIEESLAFTDPSALLGEGDRTVLTEQLASMNDAGSAGLNSGLSSFLSSFLKDLAGESGSPVLTDHLALRLMAAFGLRQLPAFSDMLVRRTFHYEHFLSSDEIASCLTGRSAFPASVCSVPDDIVYFYRNVPFAREHSRMLLQSIPLPAESWILSLLEQETKVLSRSSDSYHDALVRELSQLLERFPDALPEARETAMDLLGQANEPVSDYITDLTWPWDPMSPSVKTILSESLGDSLATEAVQPFSDLLALFPARGNDVIGDSLMASMCILPPVISGDNDEDSPVPPPDSVLPPLSPGLSEAICRLSEGRTLFRSGLFSFERTAEGAVKAVITLEGSFPVRLTRLYPEEDIIHLYSHDIPTLAVWPNLPFRAEDWHAYFIYASLPASFRITACTVSGNTVSTAEETGRNVLRLDSFPLSFSFFREDRSIGCMPNILPSPQILVSDPVVACVDFGSVGTSVVLATGHRRRPLQGPTMVRTLLNNPALSCDLLRKEFLPAVPVSALLPTSARIFRNVPGAASLPFEDGIVLMSADLQDVLSVSSDALYTCLKWEEKAGRSLSLCLHQIMLMTALQARADGAPSLSWRFAVPDGMAKAGRENLTELFRSLAVTVNDESGFSLPEGFPAVTFAAESSAQGAYFRFCASEDTRGGFMVLDLGACTADISLFLRGREQAVRTCQIPLGIHYILLPTLLRDPGLLRRELGFFQDPSFLNDLSLLESILNSAGSDPSALRKARMALDSFIADRYAVVLPCLLNHPATGMPSRLGSVLLLHFSYLMMLSGLILLQIAADPGKNDFLPEQMSLCLSGRGSIMIEFLPDQVKKSLWRFLTMFRNRRVLSLSLLFSSEKKMEIPVGLSVLQDVTTGLPAVSATPAALPVRPEELLPQFLLHFAGEFPASAEVLFQGFFTGDFYHPFTPMGENAVTAAISQSFTDQAAIRPYDALSSWIGSLLELLSTVS